MVCRVLQAEDLSVVERLGATAVVRTFFSFFRTQWPSRIPIEQPNRAKNRPPPHARPLPPEPGSEPLGYGMREQAPRPDVIACGSEHRRGERWALPQQDKSLTLSLEDESLFPQHLRQDTPRTCLAVKLATAPSACASVHGGVVAVYQYRCSVSLSLSLSLSFSLSPPPSLSGKTLMMMRFSAISARGYSSTGTRGQVGRRLSRAGSRFRA